ncbi:MAG: carbohydrate kinase family protein, partial [Candidatus Gracilibacteria bacterium]|nr:carbohydrate kinase family protein [Candidatus Gracilibacteria bacterium]
SLFAPTLRREYGGTAGNIAYNLALLGKNPEIIATVGEDAHEYIIRLNGLGIVTDSIKIIPQTFSPQGYIIGDELNRQITAFHPGAMSVSGELSLRNTNYTHAIVSPDSKEGMMNRLRECSDRGIFSLFDPGQAMGMFSREELTKMVVQADLTIMNEYENEVFKGIVGKFFTEITVPYGKIGIITLGEKGARIITEETEINIPTIFVHTPIDATGCGDAFRAGLLYGLSKKWDIEKSCRLGSILGGIKIEHTGGQNHTFTQESIQSIGEREFGEKFFA